MRAKLISAIATITVVCLSSSTAFAQAYSYNYTDSSSETAGSFTLTFTPGSYTLAAWSGKIAGVAYDFSQVGAQNSTNNVVLGGLLNGVLNANSGTNDFFTSSIIPNTDPFSGVFTYTSSRNNQIQSVLASFTPVAPVSYSYTFLSPNSNTSGSFTLTGVTGAYALTAFSGKVVGVSYDLSQLGVKNNSNNLVIGGLLNGVSNINSGTNDFFSSSIVPGDVPFSGEFDYTSSGGSGIQFTSVNFSPVMSAVPEPATWAMMIAGFGLVGGTMRRRKTAVATRIRFS